MRGHPKTSSNPGILCRLSAKVSGLAHEIVLMPSPCYQAVLSPSRQELSCNFNAAPVPVRFLELPSVAAAKAVKCSFSGLARQSRKSMSFHREHIANLTGGGEPGAELLAAVMLQQPGPGDEEEFAGHVLRASKGGADVVSELCSGIEEAM